MSMLTILHGALAQFANGRVFPDIAPEGTDRPYITYQAAGGKPINFVERGVPGKKNARIQINVWADTRLEAQTLGDQIENALRELSALQTTVLSNAVAVYEPDTKLKGSMQDFSFWN
jgi:hypothetical protein